MKNKFLVENFKKILVEKNIIKETHGKSVEVKPDVLIKELPEKVIFSHEKDLEDLKKVLKKSNISVEGFILSVELPEKESELHWTNLTTFLNYYGKVVQWVTKGKYRITSDEFRKCLVPDEYPKIKYDVH